MTERERAVLLISLCAALLLAVVGIVFLMAIGRNVAAPVSLAVVAQWGAGLAVYAREVRK